jgi:hypothetical protein
MLLLLRSPATGPVSATLTAQGGLTASGSTGAIALSGVGGLTLGDIELYIFATFDGQGTLQALPAGTAVRSASLTATGDLLAFGGYAGSANLSGLGTLSGTVGTVFQGNAILSGTGAITGVLRYIAIATLSGRGTLSAVGVVTGGVVTPNAVLAGVGNLTVTGAVLGVNARLNGTGDLSGFGFPQQVGFATQMKLSFSCDEIRTFFRKG